MTAHQGIRVNSLTTGTPSHRFEEFRKDYVYQRDPTWKPNDSRYQETVKPPLTSGSASGGSLRAGRIARFGDALRDLGYPDPRDAPAAAILEAGRRVDVGEKTARKYRAALLKQREAAS